MNVSLTPELEREVEKRVASGMYTSASEVVREALRLFLQFEQARATEIDRINGRIAEGLRQLDEGKGLSAEDAREQTRMRTATRRTARR